MTTTIDPRDFRRALAQFPTGVTVMTTLDAQGDPVGFTASSFNSVSMDPPLVLWSIDKTSWSAPAFQASGQFVVNVLSDEQMELSNRFSRRGGEKFRDFPWTAGSGGCPVLEGCAAQFECRTWAIHDGGDHLILIGEVLGYAHHPDRAPLVFARGGYHVARKHPAPAESA
jgi:flavin reductase (DIM6/NTAB) family NADH-FMN oxidoreductase RutF